MSNLNLSIKLPCGAELANRLVKAAMSENMATGMNPGGEFINAYRMWAQGGAGLLLSGNVMVDSAHLGEPNNVVIEKTRDNAGDLENWAKSVDGTQAKVWLQINHPGKQSPKFLNKTPVAPSPIPLEGNIGSAFNPPRELTEAEVYDIIERFGYAAKMAKSSGFHGVQIHGAHGYLVSQFLSPRHNQRSDAFGGSLENRMRFVKEVYLKMRSEVGSRFPIGIKINSADFSKGGFSNEDAVAVAQTLSGLGMDLIEISGGSYESPAMTGTVKESTRKREAYFLDYTKEIKAVISCPLMVTGGFRTRSFLEEVIENGEVDLIGLARPLALNPDLCNHFLQGIDVPNQVRPLTSGFKKIDSTFPLEVIWYTNQIHRMGKGKRPKPGASAYPAILKTVLDVGYTGLKRMRA